MNELQKQAAAAVTLAESAVNALTRNNRSLTAKAIEPAIPLLRRLAAGELCEKEAQQRWIRVSERLPEKGSDAIVYTGSGMPPFTAHYNYKGVWTCNGVTFHNVITYWMPLPAAPEKGGGQAHG